MYNRYVNYIAPITQVNKNESKPVLHITLIEIDDGRSVQYSFKN